MVLKEKIMIGRVPALIWGEPSDKAYIFVHGKMSRKEDAELFAEIAAAKGFQTLSFDLPQHGERLRERCDVFNGMADLDCVAEFAFNRWSRLSLYGCSIGAFFSLCAYSGRRFENCLFQSPVVDMPYLIGQMFLWFGVNAQMLEEKGEIETPVETLSWPYYTYVKEHPVTRWDVPTHILYGSEDNLQSMAVMRAFAERFRCELQVSEGSEHPFMGAGDAETVKAWMEKNI